MTLPFAQLRLVSTILVILPIIPISLNWITTELVSAYFRGFIMSHYILAAIYAKPYLKVISSNSQAKLRFSMLIATLLILYFTGIIPLFIIFGIHVSLSDTHTIQNYLHNDVRNDLTRKIFNVRHFLNGFAYFFMLRNMNPFVHSIRGLLLIGFICSLLLYLWLAIRLRPAVERKLFIDNLLFDLQLIPLVVLSLYTHLFLYHFLVYHTYFWLILPYLRGTFKTKKEGGIFLLATFFMTALWMSFEPISPLSLALSKYRVLELFALGGYLHIYSSFATSSMNPKWIFNFFHPSFVKPAEK